MPREYDFQAIESKWQKKWAESGLLEADRDETRPPYYYLNMFPYPSGVLHVGHGRNYILGDTLVRYKLMQGYNVLNPMGWDAFGLPAENAAIKFNIHPQKWVRENVANMKKQFHSQGILFDWRREVNTSDPSYYKWTQWVFLKLFEAGLAYKSSAPINWCPSCKCALANEEVVDGACERCGSEVHSRQLDQWYFKISDYAQRLLDDLDMLSKWPEKIVAMQRNWIGRSTGTEVEFLLDDGETVIPCYTTRPDTLFGVTFFSLAVEHPLVEDLVKGTEREKEVLEFCEKNRKVGGARKHEELEKKGVFTGRYVINPVNGEKVQLWVANYALMEYGTGGVMAVPAHDQRDFEFARKYDIPIKVVITPPDRKLDPADMTEAFVEPGVMVNSGPFDGISNEEGKEKITAMLERKGRGTATVKYKLRDWLISRQRYWGAPIPIVHCEKCGHVPVPEKGLPVELPPVDDFRPTGRRSPLEAVDEFVNTTCPSCGAPARRETDTIAQWLCSCWYFLRFTSPFTDDEPFRREDEEYWMPVNQYVGGAEHAVLHLLYSRFIMKVLYDQGLVSHSEPFEALFTQGTIRKDGVKMSKSLGNVVSPDDIVERFGADTLRLYTLFIGPPEKPAEWTDESVQGCYKFLRRLWQYAQEHVPACVDAKVYEGDGSDLSSQEKQLRRYMHKTVGKVRNDIDTSIHFNTAIAHMMEFLNNFRDCREGVRAEVMKEVFHYLALMLGPMAPHLSAELWEMLGHEDELFHHPLPEQDRRAAKDEEKQIVIQVNGKLKGRFMAPVGLSREELLEYAQSTDEFNNATQGGQIRKIIAIPGRLVNIVM